jgi:drug/metabolite transporter (DMT)-like permease
MKTETDSEREPLSTRWRADAVLVAVTAVWGLSFVVVKNVLREAPPLAFLFWRFAAAAAMTSLFLRGRRRAPGLLRDALALGWLLALGMGLQVVGQVDTTASKAAFLTGLSSVLTPLAAWLRIRRVPTLENGIGIALAGAGFVLLTFPSGSGAVNRGDLFVLGCAVVFAFYLVEVSERAPRHDPVWLAGLQFAVVAASSAALLGFLRLASAGGSAARPLHWNGGLLASFLYLASVGTVGTFVGQTWAQRHMTATHAAILFTLEPVFAALLAGWLLAERLGVRGLFGGALVLAGIFVSELRLRRFRGGPDGAGGPPQSRGNVSV